MAPDADVPTVPPGLVLGIWRGPYTADMGPSRPQIVPGESYIITPEQAESDHWEVDPAELREAQVVMNKLSAGQSEETPPAPEKSPPAQPAVVEPVTSVEGNVTSASPAAPANGKGVGS